MFELFESESNLGNEIFIVNCPNLDINYEVVNEESFEIYETINEVFNTPGEIDHLIELTSMTHDGFRSNDPEALVRQLIDMTIEALIVSRGSEFESIYIEELAKLNSILN